MTPAASKMQPDLSGFAPCRELFCLRQSVSASVHFITTAPHFFLTISNGSVPRTRHLRLSETTTESFPARHAYPNIPCVPFLVLLRLVRFCTSYTALSLPAHPVSFQDLSLSLGIIKSAESATVFVRKTVWSPVCQPAKKGNLIKKIRNTIVETAGKQN